MKNKILKALEEHSIDLTIINYDDIVEIFCECDSWIRSYWKRTIYNSETFNTHQQEEIKKALEE